VANSRVSVCVATSWQKEQKVQLDLCETLLGKTKIIVEAETPFAAASTANNSAVSPLQNKIGRRVVHTAEWAQCLLRMSAGLMSPGMCWKSTVPEAMASLGTWGSFECLKMSQCSSSAGRPEMRCARSPRFADVPRRIVRTILTCTVRSPSSLFLNRI